MSVYTMRTAGSCPSHLYRELLRRCVILHFWFAVLYTPNLFSLRQDIVLHYVHLRPGAIEATIAF